MEFWQWDIVYEVLPDLWSALGITISATFVGFAVAALFGLLLVLTRRSTIKPLKYAAIGFVEFVRSTPLLVQVYFIFFVFPDFGLVLSPFVAGSIGLGLHYSTYLSEVYRSGIDAVSQGQWEAAKALNFSKMQTWFRIILPQAIPPVIPVIGNYLIMMFKETPILSAITLLELLGTAKQFGADHFRYLEPITLVGLFFLLLSYFSSLLVQYLEKRLNQHRA